MSIPSTTTWAKFWHATLNQVITHYAHTIKLCTLVLLGPVTILITTFLYVNQKIMSTLVWVGAIHLTCLEAKLAYSLFNLGMATLSICWITFSIGLQVFLSPAWT